MQLLLAHLAPLLCSNSHETVRAFGHPITVQVDPDPQKPLPREIVWCPVGEHEIYAHNSEMQPVQARVVCDETAARAISAHFEALRAQGSRVWFDKNHESAEATADIRGFSWDPTRGIVATVDWTPYGERLLRDRVFCSFSPEFLRNKSTCRPNMLIVGRASGGLVNAPAFGAAMPALIAARLAGAESNATTAPAGSAGESSASTAMNKELLIKLLAALGVSLAPDADAAATDAAITNAIAKSQAVACAASAAPLQPNPELEVLRGQLATVRKERATTAVNAAVARGALPAKDEAIQAKWLNLIQADPSHEQLLAALPGNAALQRVTAPGAGIVQVRDGAVDVLRALAATSTADTAKRSEIYGRDIAPLFKDEGFALGPILAANSLGTLAGELTTQRSLSLLKKTFPWLNKISTSFTNEAVKFEQEVNTRLRTIPSLASYVPGTGYPRQNAVTTDVPVVINIHKGVEIAFNANELSATDRDLFGEQVEGAHYAIGNGLADSLLALITVAKFANETVEATADVDADTCDAIDAALVGRGVIGPRIGLFSSAVYRKLGKDTSIVNLATYKREEIITQARLPMIKNIDPYEVTLPTPAGENLTGFAGTADALALATRVPNDYSKVFGDVASNGVVQIVTNPDTGISVMLVRYIDHKAGEAAWRVALMWGVAVGNPSAGQRLISAARV